MKIVDLSPNHAHDAARLHMDGQPGTFLTSLGPDVLTALYRALPQSAAGFGFVACDEISQLSYGFVAATTSTGRLFLEMGTRHVHRFLPPLLWRFVQQPALLPKLLQTIAYPFITQSAVHTVHGETGERRQTGHDMKASSEKIGDNFGDKSTIYPQHPVLTVHDEPIHGLPVHVELLSIMVEPRHRSRGVGTVLLQRLIQECQVRQFLTLDVTVDAHNMGARRFYERHGFSEHHAFVLYGREMYSYRLAPLICVNPLL